MHGCLAVLLERLQSELSHERQRTRDRMDPQAVDFDCFAILQHNAIDSMRRSRDTLDRLVDDRHAGRLQSLEHVGAQRHLVREQRHVVRPDLLHHERKRIGIAFDVVLRLDQHTKVTIAASLESVAERASVHTFGPICKAKRALRVNTPKRHSTPELLRTFTDAWERWQLIVRDAQRKQNALRLFLRAAAARDGEGALLS